MGIENYSTTPAANNDSPPSGWPENMAPSGVNNTGRQMMADIRTAFERIGLLDTSGSSFNWNYDSDVSNVVYGKGVLAAVTTGVDNVALGENALCSITANCANVAVGNDALKTLNSATTTCARFNVAVGHEAMFSSTNASCSVAIGYCALYDNTTGRHNVAVGVGSLQSNLTGDCNVALGRDAMLWATSGCCNTSIGEESLQQLTTGSQNTALGMEAGRCITTGTYNIAIGASSMLGTAITGDHNYAVGCLALNSLTSGSHNVAIGRAAASGISTGSNNIAVGCGPATSISDGCNNIIMGTLAATHITTGCNSIFLGTCAGVGQAATGSNHVLIGHEVGKTNAFNTNCTLAIDSSDTTHPIIWGDMSSSTKRLVIPAELGFQSTGEKAGNGRLGFKTAHETHTLTLGATSDTTTISIPSGAVILGAQFCVDTAVTDDAGDDTWSAAFITGSATTLATGAAATQNTKVDTALVPEKTTAVTQIRFTPNGGNFSAGVIEIQVFYYELTSLVDQGV